MGVFTTQGYRGKLVDKLTGTILDTFKDEDIKISNNILDLFDLGEIPGTYTQQITLPGTKLNNNFFEQYYDISIWEPDLFNTNQVVEAYLDFDGIYLVNGYLQLNRVNVLENKFVDSYEVTLFGIISNFSIDTRAAFLTDLSSLSVYNHTSSYANITSSWGGGLFNGDIIYPMAEYGSSKGTNLPTIYYSNAAFLGIDDFETGLCVQDFKPAIRVKKVWDAIFNEFGYTYTGSFWNEPWLNDVYLFLNNNLRTPVYPESIETYLQASLTNISASATTFTANVSQSFPVNSKVYDYNNAFQLTGNSFIYSAPITTRFEAKLNFSFQVSHSGAAGSGMPQWYIDYVNTSTGTTTNTQVLARLNTELATIRDSRGTTVTQTFNIQDYLFTVPDLQQGGTYDFRLYYTVYGTNNFTVKVNPQQSDQSTITFLKAKQAADGKILDIPSNMPFGTSGIRVIDFIRSIQKRFNLVIYPDKTNPNQFVVESFNTWYRSGEIKDFNKFINLAEKISYTPANQLGYRQVRFSDADDTDYIETLFKRTNNRVYGESNFYDSGSYFSQGKFEVLSDVIASGPLTLVPGSGYTGSAANQTCTSYVIRNVSDNRDDVVYYSYTACNGAFVPERALLANRFVEICAQTDTLNYYVDGDPNAALVSTNGDCSPNPGLGNTFPMWVPSYISDANYSPARVLPRIFFYNGNVQATPYYIEGYNLPSTSSVSALQYNYYPYFDNYSTGSLNGTASQFPQSNARSLLYNNEQAVWGTTPSDNLVNEYWDKYIGLLYNPRTRLVEASAVIPLADYFEIELNDIAEFRGNYYHLRAINDYNLTTGECNIQLLGPIIADTISSILDYSGSVDQCAFTYTASVLPFSVTKSFGFGNAQDAACVATPSTYYLLSNSIASGSSIWSDVYLSNTASNGLYSSASVTYTVVNGKFNGVSASCYSYLSASGGQISQSGDYTYHYFTSSGTFTVVSLGDYPVSGNLVEYLVVGGGGGGAATSNGAYGPGGGGAGGFRTGSLNVTVTSYGVTVGLGGAAGTQAGTKNGVNGQTSSFSTIASLGGGYGGEYNNAGNSGSAGGGGGGILQNGGSGTAGQGLQGGQGGNATANNLTRGGGGGAGAGDNGRDGWNGARLGEISGGSGSLWLDGRYYAGGGGGGQAYVYQNNTLSAVGGGGRPGRGGAIDALLHGGTGSVNTGGGGGGGGFFGGPSGDGGAGGSGIVAVRYRTNG